MTVPCTVTSKFMIFRRLFQRILSKFKIAEKTGSNIGQLVKIVAVYHRRYLFRTNFFFLLAQVGTCLRVQELKILCFYLLSFQGYEAKTNDDSSFSQFSHIFSKLTIAHCVYMVPPSAFIFSGILRVMKNSIFEF